MPTLDPKDYKRAYVSYIPEFVVNGFNHAVYLYHSYIPEKGLIGNAYDGWRSSNMQLIFPLVKRHLTKYQLAKLKELMKERCAGIVDYEGKYYKN